MNLANLKVFTVVADELNISRAATRIYSSQQAVSDLIRRLEREYNTKLFERSPRLQLTYAGETFLRFARGVLEQERQLVLHLDDIAEQRRGNLRVGASSIRSRLLLPEILPYYNRLYPNVELDITVASASVLEDQLIQGKLDVIICLYRAEMRHTLDIYLTIHDRFGMMIPTILAPKTLLQPRVTEAFFRTAQGQTFLAEVPMLLSKRGTRVRSNTDRFLKGLAVRPNILLELQDLETLLRLVVQGMGVTWAFREALRSFLPKEKLEGSLPFLYIPLPKFDEESKVIVGCLKDTNLSWPIQAFLSLISQIEHLQMGTLSCFRNFPK